MRGSLTAFPPRSPHLPSWPLGDPCTPFVYQGVFIASSHNIRGLLGGWGTCFLTQTPWPHGDWILDKVLRQPSILGWAASAEQIPVLLGWLQQSPQGERPQGGKYASLGRCHGWPEMAWPLLPKTPADFPIVRWNHQRASLSGSQSNQ